MEWNSHTFVANGPDTVRSSQCQVYWGLKWIPQNQSGLGKISSRYFAIGVKNKNLMGAVQDWGVSNWV